MKALLRRVIHSERGVGMVMVVGFMGLCVPIIAAGLAQAGAFSKDSVVKSNLAKSQYSGIGAREYIRYLSADPESWDEWRAKYPNGQDITVGDEDINIQAAPEGYSDYGFLEYCIFGTSWVFIKENSTINCSVGSNGNITVKEDSHVYGDITSSNGNVVLKKNVKVYGHVRAGGTVTTESGVTYYSITEGTSDDPIAGPTPKYGVTITSTNQKTGKVTVQHTSVNGSQHGMTFDLQGGGDSFTVGAGQNYNLEPDNYGTVEVKEHATLNLSAGSYAFDGLFIKEWTTINLDVNAGPIIIDAVTVLQFKENVTMNVIGGDATRVVFRVESQAWFKEDGAYAGTYFGFDASDAYMHVKENSTLHGALYGDTVEIKEHAEVYGMPAEDVYMSFWN